MVIYYCRHLRVVPRHEALAKLRALLQRRHGRPGRLEGVCHEHVLELLPRVIPVTALDHPRKRRRVAPQHVHECAQPSILQRVFQLLLAGDLGLHNRHGVLVLPGLGR